MKNISQADAYWAENIIIADADYIDKVAFDLTVNFERMIGRRIPKADMARWIDCVALDGGLRDGEHETNVILIHDKKAEVLDNFAPSRFVDELTGMAFKDSLGEFSINAVEVADLIDKDSFFIDTVKLVCSQKAVKRMMIVPDAENGGLYDSLRHILQYADDDKRITVFAMQPMPGGNFRQEILGYSLMNALGIRADEIHDS